MTPPSDSILRELEKIAAYIRFLEIVCEAEERKSTACGRRRLLYRQPKFR
jgi:hypothetical protein